jgi:hypothetical protein
MSKVPIEQALKEVNDWLDYKKVDDRKRASCLHNIARMAEHISDGILIYEPTKQTFTHQLKFPIGKEATVISLTYQARLKVEDTMDRLAEAGGSPQKRVLAYIAAATGEAMAVLEKMDQEDYHIAGDLVVFFMIPS